MNRFLRTKKLLFSFLFISSLYGYNKTSVAREYPSYLTPVIKKINFFVTYPEEARKNNWSGSVKIKFKLSRDGSIQDLIIARSSGFTSLDNTALWAAQSAVPLPFPREYPGDQMEVIIPIDFKAQPYDPVFSAEKDKKDHPEVSRYKQEIIDKINKNLIYTQEITKTRSEGTTKITLRLKQDGQLVKAFVAESSGNIAVDNAAMLTVQANSPFPGTSVMELTGNRPVEITVPVTFIQKPRTERKDDDGRAIGELLPEEENTIQEILENKEKILNLYSLAAGNSQPLKISHGQLKLAQWRIKEAVRALYPALSMQFKEEDGESITDPYKSRSYGFKVRQLLYDSNQRNSALHRERLNFEVAQNNFIKEEYNLLFEILKGYYQLSAEKEILQIWEKLKKTIEKDYELAVILKNARSITQIEFLKISSLNNKVLSELSAQNNRYTLAMANLKKIMGIPPQEEIPGLILSDLTTDITLDKQVKDYIDLGLNKRPEINIWEKSIEATNLALKSTQNEKRPKLFMEGFWGKSGEAYGSQSLDLATTWNLLGRVVWLFGSNSSEMSYMHEKTLPTEIAEVSNKVTSDTLYFKMNIMDKLKYYSEVEESEVALTQAVDQMVKLKKDIAWEIQEGFINYLEGKKETNMFMEETELRQQELDLKQELFEAGEIDLSELLDAKLRLTQTRDSLYRGNLKLYLGTILLDKGTGFYSREIKNL